MAAGMSIEPQHIPEFRRLLSRSVARMLGDAPPHPPLQIDGHIELAELSMQLVADLERLAPFGPGNPPLVLVSQRLHAVSQSTVGKDAEHLLVRVEDEQGNTHPVIWWQGGSEQAPQGLFDLAYSVRSTSYRGQAEVQVEWVEARLVEEQPVELATWQPPEEVLDCRLVADPQAVLQPWLDQPGVQIWSEAEKAATAIGVSRNELERADILVVWTIPPASLELRDILQTVSPRKLILFAIDPGMDKFEPFIQRLAGLVKYALKSSQGQVSLPSLAAATAQREATIRFGLNWLQAAGHIHVLHQEGSSVWITDADGTRKDELPGQTHRLQAALQESAAYRAFYRRADIQALITL